jgi:hypothetical protein
MNEVRPKVIKRNVEKAALSTRKGDKIDVRGEIEYVERILIGAHKRLARLKAALASENKI